MRPLRMNLMRACATGSFALVLCVDGSHAGALSRESAEVREHIHAARLTQADSLSRALVARFEAVPGSDSLDYATALDLRVESLLAGDKQEPVVLELAGRAAGIRERHQGPRHLDLAVSLRNLGAATRNAIGVREATEITTRALAIQEQALGPTHLEVATTLNQLANLAHDALDVRRSVELRNRVLAIREAALGPGDALVARALVSRGNGLRALEDFPGSIRDLRRAIAIFDTTSHPMPLGLANACNNLANSLAETGDLPGALPLRERALALYESIHGTESRATSMALVNLANLRADMGGYAEAVGIYERGLRIVEIVRGPAHVDVAPFLVGLGETLTELGRLDRARWALQRAESLYASEYGADAGGVALCLDLQAGVSRMAGNDSLARAQYRRAIAYWEKNEGSESIRLGPTLTHLAALLRDHEEFGEARPLLRRALAIQERVLGPDHPDVGATLRDLADVQASLGEGGEAIAGSLRAETVLRRSLRLTASSLPERRALGIARRHGSGLGPALSMLPTSDSTRTWDVFDAVVRSRAVVLDEIACRNRSAWSAEDTTARRLAGDLADLRHRLAFLALNGAPGDPERYRALVTDAESQAERVERALAARSQAFRAELDRSRLGLREVQEALPSADALISYVRFHRSARTGSSVRSARAGERRSLDHYVALVLRDGGSVDAIPLGAADVVDALVRQWRSRVARPPRTATRSEDERSLRRAGDALRRAVWDPVARRLAGVEHVFVVPDGALLGVSLAALPSAQGTYLVESGPSFHYLSAERDLAERDPPRDRGGLLAFGGPSFDEPAADDAEVIAGAERLGVPPATMAAATFRSARPGCEDFRTRHFPPLPGAAREVGRVAELWEANRARDAEPHESALVLTGPRASEAAFKRLAPWCSVLHVATHGFLLEDACGSVAPTTTRARGMQGLVRPPKRAAHENATDNPLLLSGLLFAGANREMAAGALDEDGVLTASEIAALDLSRVRWAVLSSCASGTGQVQTGEGVLGLRRAFEIAGVGGLVTSLWSIDDTATQDWMRSFYEARLGGKLGVAGAVRSASLAMLRERRSRGLGTSPFYWGSFVSAGDWR